MGNSRASLFSIRPAAAEIFWSSRELEIAVLKELHPGEQRVTDIGLYTKVNVDRFYGIEISEFPARIAEVAMWMMDHIMNARLSAAFGESFVRIPLKTSPNIVNADALETDWANVLAPEKCSYILGNPPFGGAKYQTPAKGEGPAAPSRQAVTTTAIISYELISTHADVLE
jgi:hypothetical protein